MSIEECNSILLLSKTSKCYAFMFNAYEACEAASAAYIKSGRRTYRSIETLCFLPLLAGKH